MEWTLELVEDLRHFAGQGLTAAEIASRMGVTRNQVIGAVGRFGIALKRGRRAVPTQPDRPIYYKPPTRHPDFMALSEGQCRWPMWGHKDIPTIHSPYCGKKVESGSSYCGYHAGKAASQLPPGRL